MMKDLTERELLATAKECYNRNEFKKAKAVLSDIIENNEESVEAFFYLANIFYANGELSKAIKAFDKVLSLEPSHTDASISLSILYNDIGNYEEGKKIFEKANKRVRSHKGSGRAALDDVHINKKFAFKHYELADLYLTYDRYDEALFELNKVVALDPENLESRIRIAKVYAKKGFASKAFEELRKLKNEYPSYQPARIALGVLHYGKGNILQAQAEWENVLAQNPQHSQAAMYLNLSKTATETTL